MNSKQTVYQSVIQCYASCNRKFHSSSQLLLEYPKGYFRLIHNQKNFLEDVAKKLKIQKFDDWTKVSKFQLLQLGGKPLFDYYHSLCDVLKVVYPDHPWDPSQFDYKDRFPRGHWKSKYNQKAFLEDLKKQFNIIEPTDWNRITASHVTDCGGAGFLREFGGKTLRSFVKALKESYPEHDFDSIFEGKLLESDRIATVFGKNEETKENPNLQEENKKSEKEEKEEEEEDKEEKNKEENDEENGLPEKYPKKYFYVPDNQRKFLDDIGKKLGIQKIEDWKTVSKKQLLLQGAKLILKQYQYSTYYMLKTLYPHIEWNPFKFTVVPRLPREFYEEKKNQIDFFESLAKEFQIKKPSDWAVKVTREDVIARGGVGFLRLYGNNLMRTLQGVYPHVKFEINAMPKVPKKYWDNPDNVKKFMENFVKYHKITKPEDWAKISSRVFRNSGGAGLLDKYGFTMRSVLSAIYPGTDWTSILTAEYSISLFDRLRELVNQRKFLEEFGKERRIDFPDGWYNVKKFWITQKKGGKQLLAYYDNDLGKMLKTIFKEVEWKFPESPKMDLESIIEANKPPVQTPAAQPPHRVYTIATMLMKLLPGEEITIDEQLSCLMNPVDMYFPNLKLAIDYRPSDSFKQMENVVKEKSKALEEAGITYITVPYWWDKSEDQLVATIRKKRTDLLGNYVYKSSMLPIPAAPPGSNSQK